MIKMRRTACFLVGAAGMYFLDPSQGRARRARVSEQVRTRWAARQRAVEHFADAGSEYRTPDQQTVTGERRLASAGA